MKNYFFKHNFDSIIKYEVNLFPKFDILISFFCLLKNLHFRDTWYCFGNDDMLIQLLATRTQEISNIK